MQPLLFFVLFGVIGGLMADNNVLDDWHKFKLFHKKSYFSHEDAFRLDIFKKNWVAIAEHNKRFKQGLEPYEQGLNILSDLTADELQVITHSYRQPPNADKNETAGPNSEGPGAVYNGPSNFDWREKGVIGPVKNQGGCGSCWAFSSVAALEAAYAIYKKQKLSLSEQQLVDCTQTNAGGCGGGWVDDAYQYIQDHGGIYSESDYPYQAKKFNCHGANGPRATVRSHVKLPAGDENQLRNAVGTIGPVAVGINSGSPGFQRYSKGVFYDANCGTALTHSVAIVGFGTENGWDYWLAKNSWGTWWGDQGYIKVARNKNNNCGVASHSVYPLI